MKRNYDKYHKVHVHTFETGDSVLALLPLPNQPLQSKFYGPYKVLERAGDLNYIIATPDRRKKIRKVHVNLLKKYQSCETLPHDTIAPVTLISKSPKE